MSEHKENSGSGFGFTEIIVLVCLIAFFALALRPNFITSGRNSPTLACINNMRQIDAAINNEWALVNVKTNGVTVTGNDIKPYIKLDAAGHLPKCPMGGRYILGKVGDIPQIRCSLGTSVTPAHVLP